MRLVHAILLGLGFAAVATAPAAAQTRLFSNNSEIQLVIEAPVGTITRNARRNTDPHAGSMTLVETGDVFPIELSARGLSRRTRGWCRFPPLRLNIEGDGRRGTLFQGQNRLKIVTRCNSDDLVALEMLAYRLYNEITPYSYRVRPAQITYRDSGRDQTQFNFLIEDVDDVARRNNRVEIDVMAGEMRAAQLDPAAAAQYALFQFMIGNLDWDMATARPGEECCHNSRLLAASATSRNALIPAPYDFDFSGLVNAPYAGPPPQVPINDIRTRYYRGYCMHNDQVPGAIAHFRARRDALNAVIAGEPRLSDRARRNAQRYIDGFFEVVEDPGDVERQIIRRCRS